MMDSRTSLREASTDMMKSVSSSPPGVGSVAVGSVPKGSAVVMGVEGAAVVALSPLDPLLPPLLLPPLLLSLVGMSCARVTASRQKHNILLHLFMACQSLVLSNLYDQSA